jgi:hypothetical protein
MSNDVIQPTARKRLAAARAARSQAQDARALAEADTEVGLALASAFLDEYPAIRARYDPLAAEARELHAEIQRAKEKGLPSDPAEFEERAARGLAWLQRGHVFAAELAALAATQH